MTIDRPGQGPLPEFVVTTILVLGVITVALVAVVDLVLMLNGG